MHWACIALTSMCLAGCGDASSSREPTESGPQGAEVSDTTLEILGTERTINASSADSGPASSVTDASAEVPDTDDAPEVDADSPLDASSSEDTDSDAADTLSCGDGVCALGEDCEGCVEDCPVCPPAPGSMVITEIMKNPQAVMDSSGEWFEVVNVTDEAIEMKGMVLRDLGSDEHVIDPDGGLFVPPGGYVVFGVSADLGVGLQADYVVIGFMLDNDADEIILQSGATIIDSVVYGEASFPDPDGASLQLHGGEAPSASANDDGANWCAASVEFGAGDLGSPGEANPPCAVCGDEVCSEAETCGACAEDCGACTPCDEGELPADEECNGVDDDCDGALDEGTCGDWLGCTDDACDPSTGTCLNIPAPGGCAVEGFCVSDGAYNPTNPCQICDEDTSQVAWTNITQGPCNDEDTCTTSDVCVLGQCEGNPVQDVYEHNNTKSVATQIGAIGDGADWPAGQVNGASLFGQGDVDWFKYTVSDDWLGSFAPRADLVQVPSGSSYEICLYMVCDGDKELELKSCEFGEESSSDGMKGCCATDSVELEVNCDGSSESGTLYVKVTHKSGPWTCDHYAFDWGDD